MNDNQRSAVLASLASVAQEPLAESAEGLFERACDWIGVKHPAVEVRDHLAVSRRRVELPSTATSMTVLHAVAHLATSSVFPAHGAEFCDNLLSLADRFTPWTQALLVQEFVRRGVHHTVQHRQKAVLKAILQREVDGTELVEASLDDPPERIVGGPLFLDRDKRVVVLGGREIELSRFRYLAKVR